MGSGNGEEGREKQEGRKCFTFFRVFSNLLSRPHRYVPRMQYLLFTGNAFVTVCQQKALT